MTHLQMYIKTTERMNLIKPALFESINTVTFIGSCGITKSQIAKDSFEPNEAFLTILNYTYPEKTVGGEK